jgi:hypothetical protein
LWIVCLMFELVLADYRDVDSFPTLKKNLLERVYSAI